MPEVGQKRPAAWDCAKQRVLNHLQHLGTYDVKNSMFRMKLATALVAIGGLAGCTGSTNPETATLFDNINNLNSGEYDRQISSNEAQAAAILRNNQAAEKRISGLQRQRAANSGAISRLKSQVASARQSAANARSRVSGNGAKTAQLNSLEAQLASVSSEINSGNADSRIASAELSRITRAIKAL